MTDQPSVFAAALYRIRLSVLLPLLGGNLLILLVAAFALLIPDSHIWQLVLSALVALGLITALLFWNSIALRRLRENTEIQPKLALWESALLLSGWLLLAALLSHIISLALPNIELHAGFWNSRLSPGLRHLLSFQRLITLQTMFIQAFLYVVLPALLVPFAVETVSFGLHPLPLRRAVRVLLAARHWLIAILTLALATWLIPVLVDWHPTDTVHGEIVSAALRLLLVGLLGIAAVLLLLAVDAELLARAAVHSQPSDS